MTLITKKNDKGKKLGIKSKEVELIMGLLADGPASEAARPTTIPSTASFRSRILRVGRNSSFTSEVSF